MDKYVYVLQHSYELENGYDETKFLGVFSSLEKAESAVLEYKKLPGFKDYPNDFYIDKYEIDKTHWIEGFITVTLD